MVILPRHERCVLPCPSSSLSRKCLRFAFNYGTTSVHSSISPYGENSTPGRIQNVVISRQLVDLSEVKGRDIESKTSCVRINKGTRDKYKHRKVSFGTVTAYNKSGGGYRNRQCLSFPSTETSRRFPESLRKFISSKQLLAQSWLSLLDHMSFLEKLMAGVRFRRRWIQYFLKSLGQKGTRKANTSPYYIGSEAGSGMVKLKRKGTERSLSSVKEPRPHVIYRHLSKALGSNFGEFPLFRRVKQNRDEGICKQSGIKGDMVCPQENGRQG